MLMEDGGLSGMCTSLPGAVTGRLGRCSVTRCPGDKSGVGGTSCANQDVTVGDVTCICKLHGDVGATTHRSHSY